MQANVSGSSSTYVSYLCLIKQYLRKEERQQNLKCLILLLNYPPQLYQ